jgi:hypothetical protein
LQQHSTGHLVDAGLVHAPDLAAGLVVQALCRPRLALLVQLLAQREAYLAAAAFVVGLLIVKRVRINTRVTVIVFSDFHGCFCAVAQLSSVGTRNDSMAMYCLLAAARFLSNLRLK